MNIELVMYSAGILVFEGEEIGTSNVLKCFIGTKRLLLHFNLCSPHSSNVS